MANYHGDIHLGDTIDIQFSTTSPTTGVCTQLAGSPVISAYIGNSTTQITAGITLTADLDGVTGLNNVRVVASGGNGYGAATNVSLVITTGTVGGASAVGYAVGSFSIDCRGVNQILGTAVSTPATAGILDVNVKNINNVVAATPGAAGGLFIAGTNAATSITTSLTINGVAMVSQTGDSFARIGAPAGASVSADVAAVKTDTAAVKVQTDKLVFTVANQVDVNVIDWKGATAPAMTGDAFARIGVAGVGLTNLGDTRVANLDALVSSRMATYTQPTGFLAATFPGTVASTTNITAGIITTVTTLTNAPSDSSGVTTLLTRIGGALTISGGIVSADLKKINAVTVNGNGAGTPWGP